MSRLWRGLLSVLPLILSPAAPAADPPQVPGWQAYQQGKLDAARQQFEHAANAGDRVAAFDLAMMYWRGEGTPVNKSQALLWLRKAAQQQLPQAEHALGVLYENGDAVSKSLTQATYWFDRAATQGLIAAQIDLGTQFFLGRGAPKDYARAAYWYEKAAAQGDAGAQYLIASMYESGTGVRRDPETAIRWYARAGVQGDVAASLKALDLARQLGKGV